jgi:hypothetical protein
MHTLLFGIICFLAGPIALYFAVKKFPRVKAIVFEIIESTEKG